ncbi:ENV1 protein, partial [Daphoenositta chrysoptera]|nr:ENV1 protein [Daphoenositta chrysoptera]
KYSTWWKMIQASYQVLNQTHPELTKECWLCYSNKPPYYEAVGYIGQLREINGSNPSECQWGTRDTSTPGITLTSITGQGICVG